MRKHRYFILSLSLSAFAVTGHAQQDDIAYATPWEGQHNMDWAMEGFDGAGLGAYNGVDLEWKVGTEPLGNLLQEPSGFSRVQYTEGGFDHFLRIASSGSNPVHELACEWNPHQLL